MSKWLFGGLGWWIGGPIGAAIGYAVGSWLEEAGARAQVNSRGKKFFDPESENPDDGFVLSLVVLIAEVIKADRQVKQSEIDFVKNFLLAELQLTEQRAQKMLEFLRNALNQECPIVEVCEQIRIHTDISFRRNLLFLLFRVANADGEIHLVEIKIIRQIGCYLHLSESDIRSTEAMLGASYQQSRASGGTSYRQSRAPNWAYQVLDISASADQDEVKRAYRRMAHKHHPDRVAQMSKEAQQAATEKFMKIKDAYDTIKIERGWR